MRHGVTDMLMCGACGVKSSSQVSAANAYWHQQVSVKVSNSLEKVVLQNRNWEFNSYSVLTSVVQRQDDISDGNRSHMLMLPKHRWKVEILYDSWAKPRSKVSVFPKVPLRIMLLPRTGDDQIGCRITYPSLARYILGLRQSSSPLRMMARLLNRKPLTTVMLG